MKLYNYWRSSCSWRVRIALHVKNIPFEYIPINIVQDAQFKADFQAKNEMKQVPVLETDSGIQLAQSTAILLYLEDTHPTPHLLPKDPVEKARVWNWVEMINSGVQPFQNLATMHFIKTHYQTEAKPFVQHFLAEGLKSFENSVQKTHGKYCLGDTLTLAEVCLIPQLATSRRFDVNLDVYPTLLNIEKNCLELPAFINSRPEAQIDAA